MESSPAAQMASQQQAPIATAFKKVMVRQLHVGMKNYNNSMRTSFSDLPESHNDVKNIAAFLETQLNWQKGPMMLDGKSQLNNMHIEI
jgi:hypothetical protein